MAEKTLRPVHVSSSLRQSPTTEQLGHEGCVALGAVAVAGTYKVAYENGLTEGAQQQHPISWWAGFRHRDQEVAALKSQLSQLFESRRDKRALRDKLAQLRNEKDAAQRRVDALERELRLSKLAEDTVPCDPDDSLFSKN